MKKKYFPIIVMSLLALTAPLSANYFSSQFTTATVQAMSNAQDLNGFADLYWGESLETIQSTHKTLFICNKYNSDIYGIYIPEAYGCAYFRGPVSLLGIFDNNKQLSAILIPFSVELMPQRLAGLTQRWGTPTKDKDKYRWDGPSSTVYMNSAPDVAYVTIIKKKS